jgi:hypothetical protein
MTMSVSAADSEVSYKITTKICNGFQNGTNSKVNFTFYGTNGTYTITNVGDKMKGDSFERNKTDTYTFSASDIGQIYGLNVACGSDGVKFEYIKIEKTDSSENHLTTTFSINEWVDKTNKNFYSNRENVYRIKVVTGDNPTDGSTDKVELVLNDTAGKSATVKLNANKFSSSETELVVALSEKLGTLSTATLKKTSYDYDDPDDWRPLYVQVERMSSSTTAENIKWEAENLFIFDQEIIKDPVTVSRYNGTFKNDKASGLASIFFEPNFYVIISIVLVMVGAGVVVYIKNKKQSVKKEDAQ